MKIETSMSSKPCTGWFAKVEYYNPHYSNIFSS